MYNLASGAETSILELATLINTLTENPTPIEMGPKRTWDNSGKRFGSTEKARRELNFQAHMDISKGMESTVEWTRRNISFIDACIQKHRTHLQVDAE
mgnify:FL=1